MNHVMSALYAGFRQTLGENACHPFASLRAGVFARAQDDSQDTAHILSREVFSPNVWVFGQHNSTHALANELLGF